MPIPISIYPLLVPAWIITLLIALLGSAFSRSIALRRALLTCGIFSVPIAYVLGVIYEPFARQQEKSQSVDRAVRYIRTQRHYDELRSWFAKPRRVIAAKGDQLILADGYRVELRDRPAEELVGAEVVIRLPTWEEFSRDYVPGSAVWGEPAPALDPRGAPYGTIPGYLERIELPAAAQGGEWPGE
jgi:hypothetical protein